MSLDREWKVSESRSIREALSQKYAYCTKEYVEQHNNITQRNIKLSLIYWLSQLQFSEGYFNNEYIPLFEISKIQIMSDEKKTQLIQFFLQFKEGSIDINRDKHLYCIDNDINVSTINIAFNEWIIHYNKCSKENEGKSAIEVMQIAIDSF